MTPRQRDVLDHYRKCISSAGFTPTMKEVGKALGILPQAVKRHVDDLERDGFVSRDRSQIRGVRLTACPPLVGVPTDALRAELARRGELPDALDGGEPKRFGRTRSYGAGTGTCAAPGCQLEVQRGHLMCLSHWRALPVQLRHDILEAHRKARGLPATSVYAQLYTNLVGEARDLLDRRGERG